MMFRNYLREKFFVEYGLIAEESIDTSHTGVTFESTVLTETTNLSGLWWVRTGLGSVHSDGQQVGDRVTVHQVSLVDQKLGEVVT